MSTVVANTCIPSVVAGPFIGGAVDQVGKKIVLVLLILGIIMIVVGYYRHSDMKNYQHVIYKYIPKSYYDELYIQPSVRSIFTKMFNNASPWMEAKPGHDDKSFYGYNHFIKNYADKRTYDHADLYRTY